MNAATLSPAAPRLAPARASQILLWSIIGFTGALLLWSALAEVNETTVAAGRVVPSGQLQVVSNLEGGVVAAILAKAGDRVAAGQLLLRLDPAFAGAEYGRGTAAGNALAARIARLEAEVTGRAPVFDAGLAAAAPAAVAGERALWSARRADEAATIAGETARGDGAAQTLAGAASDRAARAEARAQAQRELTLMESLVEKGIEPAISRDRARSQLAQASAATAGAEAAVARAAAAVAEARAGVRATQGRFRAAAADALAAARAERAGQGAALPALKDRMARTEIRAPVSGTVNRVLAATIGGSVLPGQALVEIVPAGGTLVIDAMVRPADIGFVHHGQRAAIKLTAYDSAVYGTLKGRVEHISADAIVNERSGESHFEVRIVSATKALAARDGSILPVTAGMAAEVDLIGPQRTILSYLLSPVTRLRDNAFREK